MYRPKPPNATRPPPPPSPPPAQLPCVVCVAAQWFDNWEVKLVDRLPYRAVVFRVPGGEMTQPLHIFYAAYNLVRTSPTVQGWHE